MTVSRLLTHKKKGHQLFDITIHLKEQQCNGILSFFRGFRGERKSRKMWSGCCRSAHGRRQQSCARGDIGTFHVRQESGNHIDRVFCMPSEKDREGEAYQKTKKAHQHWKDNPSS